jgi:ankyrin repeat protein
MSYDIFKIGDIITDFRKKPARWGSLEEWMSRMCHTYVITGKKHTINRENYMVKRLDNLTASESSKSYETLLEIDVKTHYDYRIWNEEEVNGLHEQMKIAWEVEKVEIEKERIEQEKKDKELAKASDETIKTYFLKKKSIIKTADYFKRDLKYVWDLIDEDMLEEAKDYYDAREELGFEPEPWQIREYFDEERSIEELASKYFDDDLEKAWIFIEDFDGGRDGLEGASDYDEVYEILFPEEEEEEEEEEVPAVVPPKTHNKKTKKQKGGSKSKKGQIEKQIFNYAEHGNVQRLKQILEDKEDKFDINWVNPKENGNTPLCIAAENGRHEIVELLLENGATVDKANDIGQTPLMMSILNYYRDTTAEVLIQHGADTNKMDNDGKTPLHMACKKYGSPSMVKLLIKNGANVNEPEHNTFKNTPLHLAAMNHTDFGFLGSNAGNEANEEIATILLEAGADPELKNAKEQTVIELAESRRNHWIVEILKNFAEKKLIFMSLKRQWLHARLHKATKGVLLTQKRENKLTRLSNVLINPDLNREIKSYLGGKKRSKKYQKAGRKTRKGREKL